MKKILIISYFFFPSINIGAVRPSKIAQKLTKEGYEVDVFTRYQIKDGKDKYCRNLYSFESNDTYDSLPAQTTLQKTGIKKFVFEKFGGLYKLLFKFKASLEANLRDKRMVKAFKEFDKSNKKQYDAVFSTFGPLGSLLCGMYYKKKHPHVKWICDFRDPAVVSQLGPLRKIYMRIKEQQACRTADEIVAVSDGYIDRICGEKYKDKRHMIPNGYDKDDLKFNLEVSDSSSCLELVYVGVLYGGMRDITPVFQALLELKKEDKINMKKIRFNYAGTDFGNLLKQAECYGLADIIVNHGVLSREECLKLQFSSDLLMLATWNDKKEYGVFPGKMLEYMLIGKPIVTTVTGNVPDSEVANVIREGNLGVVYEAVNSNEDIKKMKDYLKKAYDHKVNGDIIPFAPNKNVLERYDYHSVIKKIKNLIEK